MATTAPELNSGPFLPIERTLRDLRLNRIVEGTSNIMRLFISREAMDFYVRTLMPVMNSRLSLGRRARPKRLESKCPVWV